MTTIEIRIAPESGPALLVTQSFHLDEMSTSEVVLERLGTDLLRKAISEFTTGGAS